MLAARWAMAEDQVNWFLPLTDRQSDPPARSPVPFHLDTTCNTTRTRAFGRSP